MIEVQLTLTGAKFWQRKKKKFFLPENWEEVPSSLFLKSLRILIQYPLVEAKLRLFRLWTKIPHTKLFALKETQLADLVNSLPWVSLQPDATPMFNSFEHKGIRYYLPKEKFENGIAIEYPLADEYYEKFTSKGESNELIHLVATICREENPDKQAVLKLGDIRVPLESREQVEERAKALIDLPSELLIPVLNYFSGVKDYIHNTFGSVLFPPKESEEEGQATLFGWWGVYMDIAESGVFGSLSAVHQTNFLTLCMYIFKKKKEADDREQKLKFKEELNA